MSREYGAINRDIWTDQDWRKLSPTEQWFYMMLLTHPTLSYAGVADWRPGRLAAMAEGLSKQDIEQLGAALQSKKFLLVDEDTEEVLIRSFLKHDGVMKQPKLAVSVVNAFGAIASASIRKVIIHELIKVRDANPEWRGFADSRVQKILGQPSAPIEDFRVDFTPGFTPGFGVEFTPNATQGLAVPPVPVPTPTPSPSIEGDSKGGEREEQSRLLPETWEPASNHWQLAKERGLDIQHEAEMFRLHAETHQRKAKRWNAAFTTWLKKSKSNTTSKPSSYIWD